jgi:hypothetical protein
MLVLEGLQVRTLDRIEDALAGARNLLRIFATMRKVFEN